MIYRKTTRAVTLLEVNLALGVLVFGVISVAALFPVGIKISEEACRATDGSLIAAEAKAQVEILSAQELFQWPGVTVWADRPGSREGLVDLDPKTKGVVDNAGGNRPTGKVLPVTGLKASDLKWEAGWWNPSGSRTHFVMMTSGMDAGKLFPIKSNTAVAPTSLIAKITLDLDITFDLKDDSNIHGGDSFRIIYNVGGTRSIPTDFLHEPGSSAKVKLIPTVTGIPIEVLRDLHNNQALGLAALRAGNDNTAAKLDAKKIARFCYAIVLDGPELGSPNLYRGFVLIYRNFNEDYAPCYNDPPVEYYPFFYRRPSLVQETKE